MEQERQLSSAQGSLATEIDRLRSELAQQRNVSQSSNAELERLRSEITALQEQSDAQSDISPRQLEENWQQAVTLNEAFKTRQAKDDELRVAEASAKYPKEILFKAIDDRLATEINQLRTQLEEQHRLLGLCNAELERLRQRIAERSRRGRRWKKRFAWKRRWQSKTA